MSSRMPVQADFQTIFEGVLEVFDFFENIWSHLMDEEERLQQHRQAVAV